MKHKLSKLRQHTRDVERALPLMCYKTEDEVLQVKHFVKTYYMPLLTDKEVSKLDEEYDYIETMKEV